MGLYDDLQTLPRDKSLTGCAVGDIQAVLEGVEYDALKDVLEDKRIAHAHIAAALGKHGHKVSEKTVGKHRDGKCKCH